jgi:hypothetical protein
MTQLVFSFDILSKALLACVGIEIVNKAPLQTAVATAVRVNLEIRIIFLQGYDDYILKLSSYYLISAKYGNPLN